MTRQAYGNTAMEHVWIWNEEEEKAIARAEIIAEHRMECGDEHCDLCETPCTDRSCEVCHGFTPSTDR
jgi:hypothetical protein